MLFNLIPNQELYQTNHKDGNKHNNYLYNLEWATRSENILHSYRTGLHEYSASISEDQAIKIVELLKTNQYQCKEIASIMGVNSYIVEDIKQKNTWKRLTEDCEFQSKKGRLYSDKDVEILCNYFQNNKKPDDVVTSDYIRKALYDCGFNNPEDAYDTARKIYSKRHYTRISKNYNF